MVFGATVYVTASGPVPVSPAVTLIHGTSGRASHKHPVVAETDMLIVAPSAATDTADGATEMEPVMKLAFSEYDFVTVRLVVEGVCPSSTVQLPKQYPDAAVARKPRLVLSG